MERRAGYHLRILRLRFSALISYVHSACICTNLAAFGHSAQAFDLIVVSCCPCTITSPQSDMPCF
jgi:hypothetical protein